MGTLAAAYAADVSVGTITEGSVECILTEQAEQALKDKSVSFEAVAPAATLPGNRVRWSPVKGRVSTRLEGHIAASGGFSLRNQDGSSMEFVDPSGNVPSGTVSLTVTTKTREGTHKDDTPSPILSYDVPPSSIHGSADLTGKFKVSVDSADLHLTSSAAQRINDTFGTDLTANKPFWQCDLKVSGRIG
ncbi:hypothetical protein ACH4FX_36305 [Streptomyces sp. NPDC018019]|uniref:hypothetical protein n=1 Tax=Streptomyces sp. NPDC018019 TaxID=3365030 RepID=UPI003796B12F